MDCQNKRPGATVKVNVVAKKAKVTPVDPAALQKVAPILAALDGADMPGVCKEMFRNALPHCLGVDRHGFKGQMMDLASVALMRLEEASRATLEEAEKRSENLRAKVAEVSADFEAAQRLASSRKEVCDAKGAEVDKLRAEREAAKAHLASDEKAKQALVASNAELVADQEFFQKMLVDMQQPLGEDTLARLAGKLKHIDIEPALVDALGPSLKLRADERSAFTQRAVEIAVQRFKEHMLLLDERLAEMPKAQDLCEAAVVEAQARLDEIQLRFTVQDKEYDELQNAWADLETNSKKQQCNATAFDTEIQAVLDDVEARKAELDDIRSVSMDFITMRKGIPAWTESLPASQDVGSESMQVEADVVAVKD